MATVTTHTRNDRTRTWWSLALLPLAFVAAFVVGEGLLSLYGFEVGDGTPPLWAILGASVPALLVFCVPAAVTVHLGRRALASGDDGARLPMAIAIAVTVLFLAQNVLTFVLR
jgi:hypothetical protein